MEKAGNCFWCFQYILMEPCKRLEESHGTQKQINRFHFFYIFFRGAEALIKAPKSFLTLTNEVARVIRFGKIIKIFFFVTCRVTASEKKLRIARFYVVMRQKFKIFCGILPCKAFCLKLTFRRSRQFFFFFFLI